MKVITRDQAKEYRSLSSKHPVVNAVRKLKVSEVLLLKQEEWGQAFSPGYTIRGIIRKMRFSIVRGRDSKNKEVWLIERTV